MKLDTVYHEICWMLEDVRNTNKDVYNLGALVVRIESSLYTFVKL